MQIYKGKGGVDGIAIGKISVYKQGEVQVKRIGIESALPEIQRLRIAKENTLQQLDKLYQRTVEEVGEENAAIFDMHRILLEDEKFLGEIEDLITKECVNAEYAVDIVRERYRKLFSAMDDDYMKSRVVDIRDISERLIQDLQGDKTFATVSEAGCIIVAEDITPSQVVQLHKENIAAIVTSGGSMHSHTAILAKSMGIPILVGVNLAPDSAIEGKLAVLDGKQGVLYVGPDEGVLSAMSQKQKENRESIPRWSETEQIALDEISKTLYVNMGSLKDLELIKQRGVGGIGLLRSEFVFFEKDRFPTEEEQFQIYKSILEAASDKKVIIRTLDLGADKQCDYFPLEKETNPALGVRGIRLSLKNLSIFKPQLKALFRASVYGQLGIMYPMISSVMEVQRIKEVVEEVKGELDKENVTYGNPSQGIMVETPAAVMISDKLAKEVDFFSIGTNDLTQYTLAWDRQNAATDDYHDSHHPAVLRMIAMVVENAHKAGIKVSICGELSADAELTEWFQELGVDELSVSPANIEQIQRRLLELIRN